MTGRLRMGRGQAIEKNFPATTRPATMKMMVEVLGMIGMEGGTMGRRLGGRRTTAEGAMARTNLSLPTMMVWRGGQRGGGMTMRTTSTRTITITTLGGAVDQPRGIGWQR